MLIKYTKIEKIKFKNNDNEDIEKIENEIIEKIKEKYSNIDLTIESIKLVGRKYKDYEDLGGIGYDNYKCVITEELMKEATVTLSQTLPYGQKPKDNGFKKSCIEWHNF